ncbi:MAG: hypothetical protein M3R25_13340, partial [Bacteroidota bacterium]|nr:hypothetical protein [Bacteroidota bacterium]
MTSPLLRYLLISMIILQQGSNLLAQNLAPNPDFEFYTTCPFDYAAPLPPITCLPWTNATWGTVDYFNACSNPSNVGVPQNDLGWQPAHSGVG